jgi:hypothetical protein
MTTEEDRELVDKIRHLAARINRHKQDNANVGPSSLPQAPSRFQAPSHRCEHSASAIRVRLQIRMRKSNPWSDNPYQHARGSARARGHYRGGRYQPQHRNRTLVLNGSGTQTPTGSDAGNASDQSGSWVSRNDGSLQLISSSVYAKENEARNQALENVRRQKIQQRNMREKAKLQAYFATGVGTGLPGSSTNVTGSYEIDIEGIRFRVTNGGSKLVKAAGTSPSGFTSSLPFLSTDGNAGQNVPADATPKSTTVAGVRFFRTKHGNLVRDGVVRAYRYVALSLPVELLTRANPRSHSGATKKLDVLCTFFSTTGIHLFLDEQPDRPWAPSLVDMVCIELR